MLLVFGFVSLCLFGVYLFRFSDCLLVCLVVCWIELQIFSVMGYLFTRCFLFCCCGGLF